MSKLRDQITLVSRMFDDEALRLHKAGEHKKGKMLFNDKDRWLCRNDLHYLCKITGHSEIAKYVDTYQPFCDEVSLMNWKVVKYGIQPAHSDMIKLDVIESDLDEFVQRMYLCFRVFYKSTIITKVHTIQLLLNFPNLKIVLCHNKQSNSSDNLTAIKDMFRTTQLKTLFPEYIPEGKDWGNMQGFSVACRTDWEKSEDSVEAVGVGTEITGRHYHIAKKNDLVTKDSVMSEEQRKKTEDWDSRFNIGNFININIPLQDYEGTRYHFADLYSTKQNNPKIKLFKKPIMDNYEDNESRTVPERFTAEDIANLKSEFDPSTFWCQMMLEPKDPSKQRFVPEMIVTYPTIPKGCYYYLLIDPASARKKGSDYTVMMVVAVTSENKKLIVDGIRDKLDPKQRVDTAIKLAQRWSVKGIGWEAIAFQDTDCFYFEEKRRELHLNCMIEPIKSHNRSKEDRIRGIMPEYGKHEWLWAPKGQIVHKSKYNEEEYDFIEVLETHEFYDFPLAKHDDILDVHTFLHQMKSYIKPLKIKESHQSDKMTFGDYTKSRDKRLAEIANNPWSRFAEPAYR